MATTVRGDENFYHARLDKTPEPKVLEHLSDEDRRMLYNLRSVVSGTRNKFMRLQEEKEKADLECDKERAKRKEIEERLQEYLVNMYGDDSINEELRQRLPRANKNPCVLLNGRGNDEALNSIDGVEEQIGRTDVKQDESAYGNWDDDEVDFRPSNRRSTSPVYGSPKYGRRRLDDQFTDDEYTGEYRQHRSPRRKYQDHVPPHANYPGYYAAPPPPPTAPYMPMYSYPPTGPMPPQFFMPPQSSYMSNSVSPVAQSTPMAVQGEASNTQAQPNPRHNPIQNAGAETWSPVSKNSSTKKPVGASHRDASLAASGSGSHVDNTLPGEGNMSAEAASGTTTLPISGVDPNRQIALLLAEIDRLKERNKKLTDELLNVQRQLASMTASSTTHDKEVDARVAAKVADVIDEIYQAQKQRDAAMMQRLRLANEERDEAVMRLKKISADNYDGDLENVEEIYDPDESNIEKLLKRLEEGDSFKEIGREGEVICARIHDAKKRKRRITAEEMKAILEERDAALVKMKRLEQELSRVQRQNLWKQVPDNNEQALKAKLLAIVQERDIALAKIQKLEDEMQTLRVYYDLHKSLSQEANLRDQFNNTLENISVQLKERDGNIELAQKENNILLAQLKAVTYEKNDLAEQLGKMQLSKQEADATVEKLERLVSVLRRKINGARPE